MSSARSSPQDQCGAGAANEGGLDWRTTRNQRPGRAAKAARSLNPRRWHRALRRVIRIARPTWHVYERALKLYSARGILLTNAGMAVSATFTIEPRAQVLRLTAHPACPWAFTPEEAGSVALAVAQVARATSVRSTHDRESGQLAFEAVAVLEGPDAAAAASGLLLRDMQRVIAHERIAPLFRVQ